MLLNKEFPVIWASDNVPAAFYPKGFQPRLKSFVASCLHFNLKVFLLVPSTLFKMALALQRGQAPGLSSRALFSASLLASVAPYIACSWLSFP